MSTGCLSAHGEYCEFHNDGLLSNRITVSNLISKLCKAGVLASLIPGPRPHLAA